MFRAPATVIGLVALLLVLLAGSGAWAAFTGTDVFLPSVGRGSGSAGSQWYTTVWIHNPSDATVNLQVFFLQRGTSNPDPPVFNTQVAAGETLRLENLVEQQFGLGNAFGALRIVAEDRLLVSSRIYSQPAGAGVEDSVGQYFAAVPAEFAITHNQTTELLGVYQTDPPDTSPFRYNFGFVETSGESVAVRVTAFAGDGSELLSSVYKLGPFGVAQYSIGQLLPGIDATNLRLQLETVSSTGGVVAFGSGLANRSNDPSTFDMLLRDEHLVGGSSITQVEHDASLTGDGTVDTPLGIAVNGVDWAHLATAETPADGDLLGFLDGALTWRSGSVGGGLTLPYSGETSSAQNAFSITNNGTGTAVTALAASGFAAQLASADDIFDLTLGGHVGGIHSETGIRNSELWLYSNSDVNIWLDRDRNDETAQLQVRRSDGEAVCWLIEWGRLTCVDETENGWAFAGIANHGTLSSGMLGYSDSGAGIKGEGGSNGAFGGFFFSRTDQRDLGLGGLIGGVNAHDQATSELVLSANGDVSVQLDSDSDGDHRFRVTTADGTTVFSVDETGSYVAAGTKSAVVETGSFGRRLVNAVESPGVWFEDFGTSRLDNGTAWVQIDAVFAETVNLEHDYHVFLTPLGRTHVSLLVSEKTDRGFRIEGVTLDGKPAACAVDYRIVARRRGYESVRLPAR